MSQRHNIKSQSYSRHTGVERGDHKFRKSRTANGSHTPIREIYSSVWIHRIPNAVISDAISKFMATGLRSSDKFLHIHRIKNKLFLTSLVTAWLDEEQEPST